MIGWDIFVSRMLTKSEIKIALEAIFIVKQEDILIVKNISEASLLEQTRGYKAKIISQTFLCKNNDFPLKIDFYIEDTLQIPDSLDTIKILASLLRCNVLLGDDSSNPWSYWLVTYDNGIERTSVSDSLIDDTNIEEIDLADR